MASMTSRVNYRPTRKQQQQQQRRSAGLRKASARAQLAEIDVKRKNVFLMEKMVHIHRTGGFQRRYVRDEDGGVCLLPCQQSCCVIKVHWSCDAH